MLGRDVLRGERASCWPVTDVAGTWVPHWSEGLVLAMPALGAGPLWLATVSAADDLTDPGECLVGKACVAVSTASMRLSSASWDAVHWPDLAGAAEAATGKQCIDLILQAWQRQQQGSSASP
eukprot:696898-Pelagomonas_calceolata.AAC.4